MKKKLGIMLSGRGSNFEAIARNVADGKIDAEIALVIANKPNARGLARAKELGLAAECIPSKGLEREVYDRQVAARFAEVGVEIVCLAGYMRLLSAYFIGQYRGRILNIHPSLLPAFPGLEAQRQAFEHGVKFTGCTVHFVDEKLDHGPIIQQAVVPVQPDDDADTLAARILEQEHRIYSEAIQLVLDGRCRFEGRRVIIT